MHNFVRIPVAMAVTLAAIYLSGCASTAPTAAAKPATPAAAPAAAPAVATQAKEFFVIPKDGRIHAFGDKTNYFNFLSHGEVQLTRTKIGTGPGGATVVYGITGDDVKANQPSLGELVMEGKLPPAPDFHGEVFKNGRFYVFAEYKDMMPFIAYGEVPYSFSDIGAGPKGETVVWVMNSESIKKGRPAATMARFKALRAGS